MVGRNEHNIGCRKRNLKTGQLECHPKLKALALATPPAKSPPELRQTHTRLLLDTATVDHHSVRSKAPSPSWGSSRARAVKVVARSSLFCSKVAWPAGTRTRPCAL